GKKSRRSSRILTRRCRNRSVGPTRANPLRSEGGFRISAVHHYRDAIHMMGQAGHYNDSDTGVHIWRMAAYTSALATACNWDEDDCRLIELAAPMHDTGKIGIPDSILRKPGKLDAAEWEIMKTHARIGHDILSQSDAPVFQMAAEIALRHHEKWDGAGYPDALAGTSIPESARIVALADVFDALTMNRPYKDAWPIERVMATLQESAGGHFEARLVDIFVSILPQILAIKATYHSQESAREVVR
ncbi:MAG: HD domain-containing protein, partial [Magnetococcales bacterium]|nr:HD domain-containing protein [Magnetococcales bacterium]